MSYQPDHTSYKAELVLRLILWTLFLILDRLEPFHRIIQSEEMWMYKYPDMGSYVTTETLWLLVFGVPIFLIIYDYVYNKDRFETSQAVLSLSLNYGITGVLTTLFKNAVGRPRPNFFYRCFPNGKANPEMECTGKHRAVMDARKSFPSGHSSFAFACMVFVSLYLSGRLHVFNQNGRGQAWRILLVITPIVVAALIAVSRTCDYHHHWEDVCAGSLLGTVVAYFCYRQYFPRVTSPSANISYAGQEADVPKISTCK